MRAQCASLGINLDQIRPQPRVKQPAFVPANADQRALLLHKEPFIEAPISLHRTPQLNSLRMIHSQQVAPGQSSIAASIRRKIPSIVLKMITSQTLHALPLLSLNANYAGELTSP